MLVTPGDIQTQFPDNLDQSFSLSLVPTVLLKVYGFLKLYLFTYLVVFMWMGVLLAYVCICLCLYTVYAWYLERSEGATGSPGPGATDGCEPPKGSESRSFGRAAGAPASLSLQHPKSMF